MRYRFAALLLALVVFLCPFSVFADGMPVTFGISVYDATTGTYLVQNQMINGILPLFYFQTMDLLEEQGVLDVEYDENNWPISVETAEAATESTAEAVFYLKVNGDILDLDSARHNVADGCLIEWIYSDELHATTENRAFTRTNRLWKEEHRAALNEAARWLSRQSSTAVEYYAALSIAGQTLPSTVVVELPERAEEALKKKDASTYIQQLFLLSACGYHEDQKVVAYCIEQLATGQMDTSNVMLASAVLWAYDSHSYTLPENAYNTRDLLVRRILSAQNSDGGFARTRGFASDFEATVDALTVLSQYDGENVDEAIRGGMGYLANWLQENGVEKSSTLSGGQVVSQMLTALVCVGADLTDERFTVDGVTLPDILLSMQNADGGFAAEFAKGSDLEATQDALIALTALREGRSPYCFGACEETEEEPNYGVSFRMTNEGQDGLAYSGEMDLNNGESLPGWAIALMTGGAVVLLGGIVVLIVFMVKRRG